MKQKLVPPAGYECIDTYDTLSFVCLPLVLQFPLLILKVTGYYTSFRLFLQKTLLSAELDIRGT